MIILSDDAECSSFPVVNTFLIIANAVVFLAMMSSYLLFSEPFYIQYGLVPARFLSHRDLIQFATIFTAMFMHAGFFHIIGNMWALWMFGDNVEDKLGHFNYLFFYVTCGVLAACAHMISDPHSMLPCIGASGAIAGVMAAYMVLFPDAKCKTWFGDDSFFLSFRTFKIPAVLVIGGWFVFQALATVVQFADYVNVAIYAHIGGFTAGVFLVLLMTMKQRRSTVGALDGRTGLSRQQLLVANHELLPASEIQYNPLAAIWCTAGFVAMMTIFGGSLLSHASAQQRVVQPTPIVQRNDAPKHKYRTHSARTTSRSSTGAKRIHHQ